MLKYDRDGPDISIFNTSSEKCFGSTPEGVLCCSPSDTDAVVIPIKSVAWIFLRQL